MQIPTLASLIISIAELVMATAGPLKQVLTTIFVVAGYLAFLQYGKIFLLAVIIMSVKMISISLVLVAAMIEFVLTIIGAHLRSISQLAACSN